MGQNSAKTNKKNNVLHVFKMIPARGPQTSRYIIFNVYNMDVSLGEEIATAGSAAVKHTAA